jgi:biotin carboxyl carrier protein
MMTKENQTTNSGHPGKLESPEQLSDYVRVTSVSPLLIGCTILLLLGAFVLWGVFGTVTDRVEYSGLIFPHHGTDDVTMDSQGTITKMFVHTGDTVAVGQLIARVQTMGKDSMVHSTLGGTVLFTKQEREGFEPQEPLVSMVCEEHVDHTVHTMLVAYVDMETQHNLREGMEAQVWPKGEKRDEIGYVRGVITSIDRYPTPREEIVNQLKSTAMAEALFSLEEGDWQVIIELKPAPQDSTHYDWSFGQPHNVNMGVGTYCNVLTETQRRSMYQYLFGVKSE